MVQEARVFLLDMMRGKCAAFPPVGLRPFPNVTEIAGMNEDT